jgi:GMP synthase-like glutamine amidotransferase
MRVLVIQHDADKGLGLFVQPLAAAQLELDVRFAGHGEIELEDHAAVIALPGLANPDDETPAIASTRAVLREALRREIPALGICLGAELLAEAAGGVSRSCEPEYGYCTVTLEPGARDDELFRDLPAQVVAFQAHGFAVELPPGAVALASSPHAPQAFRLGAHAWGIQFHPEPTLEMLDAWTRSIGHFMEASGVDPEATRRLARRHVPEWCEHTVAIGRRFAGVARAAAAIRV